MSAAPSLFVAHGSPMLALEGGTWGAGLHVLGQHLKGIRAFLVCSAHWETSHEFKLSSAQKPGILHDFGGFPEPLYRLDYPAPGDPELAAAVGERLMQAGIKVGLDDARALDHGAWVPLRYLAGEARLPVVQLSLPRTRTPEALLAAGKALAPLREQGVLILGSGGIVHNLGRLDWHGNAGPKPWAVEFQAWVDARLEAGDIAGLMQWRDAPGAAESVPTSEHLDPLFVALGASDGGAVPFFQGWQMGSLSLTSYRFGAFA